MSIETYSAFIYGHTVTENTSLIAFNEGSGEIVATLPTKSFTITEFGAAIANAMNQAGTFNYEVTLDRSTRAFTITTNPANNFDLLIASATNTAESAYPLMGFTGADQTGTSSYVGADSGDFFEPQNILQSYLDFDQYKKTTKSTVNVSASGRNVEVVSYGRVRFMECNVVPQTDVVPQEYIKEDPMGQENLRAFLDYATTKAPIEFLPDINTPSTFNKVLLESTVESKNGVDYKVKQFKKLFKWFQSGKLVFRELD